MTTPGAARAPRADRPGRVNAWRDRREPPLQRQLGEVAAAVEDQRLGAFAALAAFDLADEDHVVALFVAAAVEALEHRGRAVDDRRAAAAFAEGHAGKAVGRLASEALGQLALLGREDVDRVVRAAREGR